ncbi:MAG: N-6 DNA methylase [Flavobacteriales bacterium]|nr:N-6 DNA methylase [Flavobacteriales bacterium]
MSATVTVDNKVVRTIVEELYYPKSPYEFSVLSVEILGSAYEQFLGKRIRVDKSHRATIEEKPEVRKAGGVFYTPQYIVDHIVERTVGEKVKGRTPKEVAELRILDPACGSGSFLLGAYQYLLDWHKAWYREQAPAKGKKRDAVLRPDGELTSAVKKDILINNIFGVDLDPSAVEVTKLSLLLKCMEGETAASVQHSLDFAQERVLPTLDRNVLCGNSLVDTDYYDGMSDLGEDRTIKPFSWSREFKMLFDRPTGFVRPQDEVDAYNAHVKSTLARLEEERKALGHKYGTGVSEPAKPYGRKGGSNEAIFDMVIGNPPYVQQAMYESFDERQKEYLLANYSSSMGRMNTFGFFIEKGIRLLRPGGMLGFIVPNTVLTQEYYKPLRRYVLDHACIREIVTYEKPPFADAVVEAVTLLIEKTPMRQDPVTITIVDKDLKWKQRTVPGSLYVDDPQVQFSIEADDETRNIRKVVDGRSAGKLGSIADINQAIALKGDRAAYLHERPKGKDYKPVLDGREIQRYRTRWSGKYLRYDINAIHSCKREDIFLSAKKILFRRVSANLVATIDDRQFYALNTLVAINLKEGAPHDLELILGLFNSKLWNFYYTRFLKSTKKVFSEIQARSIAQLPLPHANKKLETEIVRHVRSLLENVPQVAEGHVTVQLERRIAHLEQCIDHAVYALYGLSEQEVTIVESSLAQ